VRDTVNLSFQGKSEVKLFKNLRAHSFLIFLVVYFICGFTDIPIVTHMAPFILEGGFDEMIAANILSLIGGTTLVGTLLFGFLSRKFERKLLLVTIYLIRALTFFILFDKPYMSFLIVFAIFFGLTQFSMVPLISAWIGDTYGQMYLGRLFGIITLLHALGASLGTILNGFIFDLTDSYLFAFIISSALSFIASILIYFTHEQT